VKRLWLLAVLFLLAGGAQARQPDPSARVIAALEKSVGYERKVLELYAAGDFREALDTVPLAQRYLNVARSESRALPAAAGTQVRIRINSAYAADQRIWDLIWKRRIGLITTLTDQAIGDKEAAAVMSAAEKKETPPVTVNAPACRSAARLTVSTTCSLTHYWDVNVPSTARFPRCYLLNPGTGRSYGLGVFATLEGQTERRTCRRLSPTRVRLTLVLTSDGSSAPTPRRAKAVVAWR
jgi:hypothetical protein